MGGYKCMSSAVMSSLIFFTVCIQVATSQTGPPPPPPAPYSRELETQLRGELFSNYSILQRPSERIVVEISLTVFAINELDIKNQQLSIAGYITMKWMDDRLSWKDTSTDYSNVRFLFTSELEIWRPSVIFENSVDDIEVVADPMTPMRIKDTGTVTWSPADVYKVYCESDITYYPLDLQYCDIKISAWGYTETELKLDFSKPSIIMEFFSENGEWEIIQTTGTKSENKARGGQTFSSLTFSIQLRRRLIFHALNTLFPVALMAFLIPLAFILHVDSGEKIGYSLTVLLAYAVYLTLISENIPSTSITVCYLSLYLALILTAAALSVFCTILVINCHQQEDGEEIPRWLVKFTVHVLANITLWKGSACRNQKSKCSSSYCKSPEVEDVNMHQDSSDLTKKDIHFMESESTHHNTLESTLTWKLVSKILDKFFFIVYMSFVIITTLFLTITIFNHYHT